MISAPSSSLFKAPLHEKYFLKACIRAAAASTGEVNMRGKEHTTKRVKRRQ
jgi:hypothetical protein